MAMPFLTYGLSSTANTHSLFGTRANYDEIDKLKLIPMLISSFTVTSASLAATKLYAIQVHPDNYRASNSTTGAVYLSHAANINSMHRYYRGGSKISLRANAHSFINCRIRVVVMNQVPPSSFNVDEISNIPSMIFDINGDTCCNFTIPYMSPTYMSSTIPSSVWDLATALYMAVYLEVPPPPLDDVQAATVDFNVWVSAAEDMIWSGIKDSDYTFVDPTPLEAPHKPQAPTDLNLLVPRKYFQEPFPFIIPADTRIYDRLTVPEHTSKMSHIMAGDVSRGVITDGTVIDPYDLMWSAENSEAIGRVLRTFQMFRGSVKLRLIPKDVASSSTVCFIGKYTDFSGVLLPGLIKFNQAQLCYDVPMVSDVMCYYPNCDPAWIAEDDPDGVYRVKLHSADVQPSAYFVFVAAGNDFSIGWPRPVQASWLLP
jgi:hypothetical protein